MRRFVGTLAAAALIVAAGCGERIIEQIPPGGEDIDIDILSCDFDPATGLATAQFQLTSEQEYASVLLQGELSDDGIVIGTGTGSATGLEPGVPYRGEMVFSLASEPDGEVTCDVFIDLANPR